MIVKTTEDIIEYLRAQDHKYDKKIGDIKQSITDLDKAVENTRAQSKRYFVILFVGLVCIGALLFNVG